MITDNMFTSENFIAIVDINNETGCQVTLPLQENNIRIDWGDGHI